MGAFVTGVTNGSHGTVVINADGTVTYTPNPGFFGTDTFTYTATSVDGNGQDTAVVTVVIAATGEVNVGVGSTGVVLDEAHLQDGSTPDPANLSKTGSFTVLAEDGLKSLTVDGVQLIDSDGNFIAGQSVMEGQNLRITFDSITVNDKGEYTIGVTGTLIGDFDHIIADGNDKQLLVNFDIVLEDRGGKVATGTRSCDDY